MDQGARDQNQRYVHRDKIEKGVIRDDAWMVLESLFVLVKQKRLLDILLMAKVRLLDPINCEMYLEQINLRPTSEEMIYAKFIEEVVQNAQNDSTIIYLPMTLY